MIYHLLSIAVKPEGHHDWRYEYLTIDQTPISWILEHQKGEFLKNSEIVVLRSEEITEEIYKELSQYT